MKKLLGILVLGLLWCNVGFAEVLNYVCQYKAADKKINIQLNLEKNQIKHDNKIAEIVVKTLTQVVFLKSGTFPNYRVFTYAPHDSASLQQIGVGIRNIELIKERLRKGDLDPIYANCSGDQIAEKPEKKKPKKKKTTTSNISPELKLIEDMYKSGALTKEEYEKAKNRALK